MRIEERRSAGRNHCATQELGRCHTSCLPIFLFLLAGALLTACGGSSGSSITIEGRVVVITVDGIEGNLADSTATGGTIPPQSSFSNAGLRIVFNGPIDPASLTPDGPAVGSISVYQEGTLIPAIGSWSITGAEGEIVVFSPRGPIDNSEPCALGIIPEVTYVVEVATAANGAPNGVLRVAGALLMEGATARFQTATCTEAVTNYGDSPPGPPVVIANTPPALGEDAPAFDLSLLNNGAGQSQVIVEFNEPIDPQSMIDNPGILLIHANAAGGLGLPLPLESLSYSPGDFESIAGPHLIVTTPSTLRDGETYEIRLTGLRDLAGNEITDDAGPFRFALTGPSVAAETTFVETFDDTENFGELSPASLLAWNGDGGIFALFPSNVGGNGNLGALTISESMTINTDDFVASGDIAGSDVFNFTSFVVNPSNFNGLVLNFTADSDLPPFTSRRGFRVQATQSIDIGDFTVFGAAGNDGTDNFSLGNAANTSLPGGAGGPGAGRGGRGSPIDGGASSPTGEAGFGASIDAADPLALGTADNTAMESPFFGGGQPGIRGLSPGQDFLGASGGGGGTSSQFDGDFSDIVSAPPKSWSASTSSPGEGRIDPTAPLGGDAGPAPAAFLTPMIQAVGGSGGGSGGDRVHGSNPEFENPAGGAGGGGGAIQLSSVGPITIGDTVQWRVGGGEGGTTFFGTGGSSGGGAGGSVLLRSLDQISVGAGTFFDAGSGSGGGILIAGPNGEGGRGSSGVIQIEDSDPLSMISNLVSHAVVRGELFAAYSGGTNGGVETLAVSELIDTGSRWTRYLEATATTFESGTGTVSVFLRGVAEDPEQPGQPATTMVSPEGLPLMSAQTPLDSLGSLSGYRFFRFEARFNYPAPPMLTSGDSLPAFLGLSVTYEN